MKFQALCIEGKKNPTPVICIFYLCNSVHCSLSIYVGLMVIQTLLEVLADVVPTGSTKCNRNYSPSLLMTVIAICHNPDIALGPGRVEKCACVPILEDAQASYSTAYARSSTTLFFSKRF